MRLRSLAIIVFLLACLSSQVWSASPEYVVTDVGTLGRDGWAESVNNLGQVVGGSYANVPGLSTGSYFLRAFRWDRLGGMTDLGTLGAYTATAYGINDAGQVAGYSDIGQHRPHGFIWQDGVMSDLGCPPTWRSLIPTAINNRGQVVGYATTLDWHSRAFLWQNGVMTELTPPAGCQDASANDINDLGQVVGWALAIGTRPRAIIWENGQPREVGALPGYTGSAAYHINNRGQITGVSYGLPATSAVGCCCLWENGTVTDLRAASGTLLQRFCAINDKGTIVGPPPDRGRPHVWRDGSWLNLNRLIAQDSGWQITSARDINNRGQIAGSGVYNGEERVCLLTPYIRVAVDIRPGSRVNPINLGARGLVPVAILGAADFDPREVDPASVLLAGAPVAKRPFGRTRYMARMMDVNHDRIKDLLLLIVNEELNLQPGDTKAVLTGTTYDGSPITGEDSVKVIVPRGKR